MAEAPKKKKVNYQNAWAEARELLLRHRTQLAIGLGLMIINRLAGLVLPASSKWLIDEVIGKHRGELLVPLALAAGVATVIQAATSFGLSQVVSVAGQRAITDLRRRVQA
jgi:ABC-type bacteriocin/lantibiotic exporter with double-glycine peptidase domain